MKPLQLLSPAFSEKLPKTIIQKNNPALTELIEGVAHELNNIVAIVLGNVQLIKLKNHDESVTEGLDRIEKSIIKSSGLIKAIQQYAGNNEHTSKSIINFSEALITAMEFDETSWKEEASEKDLTIHTTIQYKDCPINADMQELVSAISHLLHNAIEASPKNGTIGVSINVFDNMAVLAIADSGTGIAESIKLKIYEPFFSTKGTKGSGLGLTIVQSIVSRYGGRVGFSENKTGGTLFTVSFPVKGPVDSDSVDETKIDDKEIQRILIVDDDDEIRNVLMEMLLIEGFYPEHCPDAYCAMELLEKSKYDMIITDLGMPGMSGYDLAEYVQDKYENIQIVLLTGWGSSINKLGKNLKGVKAVLSKPFRLNQVLDLVRN